MIRLLFLFYNQWWSTRIDCIQIINWILENDFVVLWCWKLTARISSTVLNFRMVLCLLNYDARITDSVNRTVRYYHPIFQYDEPFIHGFFKISESEQGWSQPFKLWGDAWLCTSDLNISNVVKDKEKERSWEILQPHTPEICAIWIYVYQKLSMSIHWKQSASTAPLL